MYNFKELKNEEYKYIESSTILQKGVPVFIRLQFRAFNTFSKPLKTKFDAVINYAMEQTTIKLCQEVQGTILALTTRDIITLVVVDFNKLNSTAWLGYDIANICSATASIASVAFTKNMLQNIDMLKNKHKDVTTYEQCMTRDVSFSCKCFNVPTNRIVEMLYLKQLECRRESVQLFASQYLDKKTRNGKSNDELVDLIKDEYGVSWDTISNANQIGYLCHKGNRPFAERRKWRIDSKFPLMNVGDNRRQIDEIINSIAL